MTPKRRISFCSFLGALFLTACLSLGVAQGAWAKRAALIVGNAGYSSIYPLANPVNDASALAEKLEALKFDVTLLTDAHSADFWSELTKFTEGAAGADTVLFFFAGHAFQLDGINYLVPTDAQLSSREAIRTETWDLDAIIARLNSPDRQTLIFLDACRNNPLPKSIQAETQGRRGLARLQTGRGTFVAFATEPNNVTYDGDEEAGHSPFTQAILDNIETPGISISDMMIKVRNAVQERTFERQTPWDQSSLNAQFYFKEAAKKKETGFGAAELELLAALPEDQRAAFLELLKKNGIKTAFSEEDIVETIVIKKAAEKPKGGSILIAGAAPKNPTEGMVPERAEQVASDRVTGSDAQSAENVQIAAADPKLITGQSAPIVELERTGPSRTVGTTEAVEVRPGIIVPPKDVVRGGVFRSVTLSSLIAPTLPPDAIVQASYWLEGAEIDPNSELGLAILQDVYGGSLKIVDGEVQVLDEGELKKSVQAELGRLGCYRLTVDGDWGRGSRTAAARYFAAKLIVPDSLEATPELLRQLKSEENVVCQNSVAKDRRVAKIVEEPEQPRRSLKSQTVEQKKETQKKIGLRPGVFR